MSPEGSEELESHVPLLRLKQLGSDGDEAPPRAKKLRFLPPHLLSREQVPLAVESVHSVPTKRDEKVKLPPQSLPHQWRLAAVTAHQTVPRDSVGAGHQRVSTVTQQL